LRLTNKQRQAHIKVWQQSGLSRKQYCQKQNIGYSTFCKWIQNFQADKAQFIKLAQANNTTSSNLSIRLPNGIQIDLQSALTSSLLQLLQNA